MGFTQTRYDECVYTKIYKDVFVAIGLYVDDFYIFTNKPKEAEFRKSQIGCDFDIKDLGEARKCLGIQIIKDKDSGDIRLSQETYVKKVLAKYGMQDCKPVSTPVETNVHLKPGVGQDIKKLSVV
jgi:hypothetical protein